MSTVQSLRKLAVLALILGGCTVGPDYKKPDVETPAAFKESGEWVVAKPADTAPKGQWWQAFNDPVLNGLVEQVSVSNQTLKAAEARYTQAVAATALARSAFYPTLGVSAGASRNGGGAAGNAVTIGNGGSTTTRRYTVEATASWEIDLWGRVRRLVEAANAEQQATASDVENTRLSMQAELATDYFQLRATDAQITLLEDTVKAFQTSYDMTQNRYRSGVAARADVVQAETQLKSTQAQAIDLRGQRAQLEHAIAVLAGHAPASFAIAPANVATHIPTVPPGLPSTLLERRPDIAAAERRMAEANAHIGAAEAAYFPTLDLNASYGFASAMIQNLFNAPNRFWSIGATAAETILDFGARQAQVESAKGAYDEAVANYRQTALGGFQEVEDNLALLRWLADEAVVENEAVRAARESVTLTLNQYKAGTVSYLNVVQVQATQLSEERNAVNVLSRRLVASVALVKALGGSWEAPAP
jgi:NodT family efflux transporter outer membrane factor (OMF) lipoprotein